MHPALVIARHWSTRTAVVVVLAVVGLTLPAAPAGAHGQLALAKPLAGSVVGEPLERLELSFTEKPSPNAYFTITAPGGGRVDNGWSGGQPIRLDKPVQEYFLVDGSWQPRVYNTGFPALVPVAHWPAQGEYVATYLSVASDGETVQGSVKFRYNGRTTPAPAGWTPPTNGPDPALLTQASPSGSVATTTAGPVAVAPDATVAAAPEPRSNAGVWVLPVGLVIATALMIGHAARKPALSRPVQKD